MLKKVFKFTDFKGNEREETHYFNLSKAEAMEIEMSTSGGLTTMINRIVAAQDTPEIIKVFKSLILKSYGEISDDGRRFMKSEELSKAFSETEAYSQLFMELGTDSKAAAAFVNGIVPQDDAVSNAKSSDMTENSLTPVSMN